MRKLEQEYGIEPPLHPESLAFQERRNQGLWIAGLSLFGGALLALLIASGGLVLPLTALAVSEVLVSVIVASGFAIWAGLSLYFYGVDKDPRGHENRRLDELRSPHFRKRIGLILLTLAVVGLILITALGGIGLLGALTGLELTALAMAFGTVALIGVDLFLKGANLQLAETKKSEQEQKQETRLKNIRGWATVLAGIGMVATLAALIALESVGVVSLGLSVFSSPVILVGFTVLSISLCFSGLRYLFSETATIKNAVEPSEEQLTNEGASLSGAEAPLDEKQQFARLLCSTLGIYNARLELSSSKNEEWDSLYKKIGEYGVESLADAVPPKEKEAFKSRLEAFKKALEKKYFSTTEAGSSAALGGGNITPTAAAAAVGLFSTPGAEGAGSASLARTVTPIPEGGEATSSLTREAPAIG